MYRRLYIGQPERRTMPRHYQLLAHKRKALQLPEQTMSSIVVEWSSRPLPELEGFIPSWRLRPTSLLKPMDLVTRPEITDWMYRLRKSTLNNLSNLEHGRIAYSTASEAANAARHGALFASLECSPWVEVAKVEDLRLHADMFRPAGMAWRRHLF